MVRNRAKGQGVRPIWVEKLGLFYAHVGEKKNGRTSKVYAPKTVQTEKQAWLWLEARQAEREARKVDRADPTVFGLCQMYLGWQKDRADRGVIGAGQFSVVSSHLTLFWEESSAGRPVREMRAGGFGADDLASVVESLKAQGYSGNYVVNFCRTVKATFNWASRKVAGRDPARLFADNPIDGFKSPNAPQAPDRFVEPAVIRRFMRWAWSRARAAPGHSKRFDRLYILLFRFCYLTGARPGEACRLTWPMVDRRQHVIVIPADQHKTGGKTGKPREIQITPPVGRILNAIGGGIDPYWHPPLCGPLVWPGLEGRHPSHVFTHRRAKGAGRRGEGSAEAGEPWPSGSAASKRMTKLRRAAIAAGVEGVTDLGAKRLIQYTNRHNYASNALMKGMTCSEAAELLGNTEQMVAERYGHIQRTHTRRKALEMVRRGRSL